MFTKKKIFRIFASILCVAMTLPSLTGCRDELESSVESQQQEKPQATVIAGDGDRRGIPL